MVVRYRNSGAWGAGEGARLSSLQVDENFFTLEDRVQTIIDNPIPGLGIANIAIAGTRTLRVTMDDNSSFDFLIPVVAPHWRDEWAPDTDYFALDRFWVTGIGLFLVLYDHTSSATFDLNETFEDTDGEHDLYYQEFGLAGLAAPTATVSATTYTLSISHLNHFLVFTNDSGCVVTIPEYDATAIPVGTEFHLYPAGAGAISLSEAGATTIYPVPGFLAQTAGQGRPITVKKVAVDDWVMFGGLASEASTE